MKFKLLCCLGIMLAAGIAGCGFHLPNQTSLGSSLKEINVSGDYHHDFYKLVVQKLQVRGVKVNYQGTHNREIQSSRDIPSLEIPTPVVKKPIASVDAFGAAKEYNIIITTAATLRIPNHNRPIIMRNGLTRFTTNKPNNALGSANEQFLIEKEMYEELANQMILRINYLGRQSDPNTAKATPAQLILAKDENNNEVLIDNSKSMTLLDALSAKNDEEKYNASSVNLSDLNNGIRVLNEEKTYKLPRARIKMVNEAPDELSEKGFIKQNSK